MMISHSGLLFWATLYIKTRVGASLYCSELTSFFVATNIWHNSVITLRNGPQNADIMRLRFLQCY